MTSAALVYAANVDNPWPGFRNPAPGPARSIGEYSGGCLQGAQALPLDGPGYQVMRPSRRRYFGHPVLVDFVRLLGRRVQNQKLGTVLVGDLSQVRGGRSSNGHASHQTGLDVDVWYAHPPAARKKLSTQAREELQAEDVVDLKRQVIVPRWSKHVARVLRLVADDTRVERVFVNPVVKATLCQAPAASRGWLRKIRPWYGHADHFHVRLACVSSDVDCKAQAPLAPGDGCDKLSSWLRPRRPGPAAPVARKPIGNAGPPKALVEYRKAIAEGHGWPEQCNALLEPELPENGRLARSDTP
jgi:penicillin-insensitive murein DD-endopeptidase